MTARALLIALTLMSPGLLTAQEPQVTDQQRRDLTALVDAYSRARAQQDAAALEGILTADMDQLVSSGEWRRGRAASMTGMSGSSANNPGTRTLTVDSVRLLTADTAVIDARYDIRSTAGVTRNMWSTFVAVQVDGRWKIAAIRNMLPREQ